MIATVIGNGAPGSKYLKHEAKLTEAFLLVGNAGMCLLCLLLVGYLRHHRHVALRGDLSAARKVLLPAFEPLLWILGFTSGICAVVFTMTLWLGAYVPILTPNLVVEIIYCARQFVLLVVLVFMLQKSVSIPALQRSVVLTLLLATYTLPIVLVAVRNYDASISGPPPRGFFWLVEFSRLTVLAFYAYVFVRPPARATKRTLREYCAYATVYHVLLYVCDESFRSDMLAMGHAFTLLSQVWAALSPFFIWRVLKADTAHWRGLGQRACALQTLFRQKNDIHERLSSQGLHVLIEMHRKFVIDFAYLALHRRIGAGTSATVFDGLLHWKTPVAVKAYTPIVVTEEIVASFSHEAALCGSLNHPNIVKFYGLCICPPMVCLVSELCIGNLEDMTVAVARKLRREPFLVAQRRQQQLISLGYMLDAARAIAYIHSFSPAFLHRDVKPSNFVVDAQGTIKLTDFGESRHLPRAGLTTAATVMARASVNSSQEISTGAEGDAPNAAPMTSQLTVKGTVDYMAPELIQGRAGLASYAEGADIYSLAVTMWDVLFPGCEKFPSLRNNHLHVLEAVASGQRPSFAEGDLGEPGGSVHPAIREVIEMAWQQDAQQRPTAQHLVQMLESIQEELCTAFATTFANGMAQNELAQTRCGSHSTAKEFSGAAAVEHMRELQYVMSVGEALRLGSMLMDAGVLHHNRHTRNFENSSTTYFLDHKAMALDTTNRNAQTDASPRLVCPTSGVSTLEASVEGPCVTNLQTCGCSTTPKQSFTTRVSRILRRKRGDSSSSNASRDEHSMQGLRSALAVSPSMSEATRGEEETTSSHRDVTDVAEASGSRCACRKLGQRLQTSAKYSSARRHFRRRHRGPGPEETALLTSKLLEEDHLELGLSYHLRCERGVDLNVGCERGVDLNVGCELTDVEIAAGGHYELQQFDEDACPVNANERLGERERSVRAA